MLASGLQRVPMPHVRQYTTWKVDCKEFCKEMGQKTVQILCRVFFYLLVTYGFVENGRTEICISSAAPSAARSPLQVVRPAGRDVLALYFTAHFLLDLSKGENVHAR